MAHLLSSAFRLPKWISFPPFGSRRTAVKRPPEGRVSAENRGGALAAGKQPCCECDKEGGLSHNSACSRCNISPRGIREPAVENTERVRGRTIGKPLSIYSRGCENATHRGSDSESNSAARFTESVMMCSAASDLFESHETL